MEQEGITYRDQTIQLNFVPYGHSGNTALELLDNKTNRSIELITTNIDEPLPKNIILIKASTQKDTKIKELIKAKIINTKPEAEYSACYTNIFAYTLTKQANNIRKEQYRYYQYESIFI